HTQLPNHSDPRRQEMKRNLRKSITALAALTALTLTTLAATPANAQWSFERVGPDVTHASAPAAIDTGDTLHVFTIGTDSGLYDNYKVAGFWHVMRLNGGATFRPFQPMPILYGSVLHVFTIGTNDGLYDNYLDGNNWTIGRVNGGATFQTGASAVVSSGLLHVFLIGKDGLL